MPKYDCAVFDLDGTLLDTLDDLTYAVNRAMQMTGRPVHDRLAVRAMIGNGVRVLIERALGENASEALTDRALAEFRACYTAHLDVYTREYAGITPMLRRLKAEGIRLCVCSNKFDAAVQTLISAHFPGLFDAVAGEGNGIPKKPAPDGVLHVLRLAGASPDRACYVGDSAVDCRTAQNAGLPCLSVTWGFADRSALLTQRHAALCDSVAALEAAILG